MPRELPKELSFEGEAKGSEKAFRRLSESLELMEQEARDEMTEEEARRLAIMKSSPWGDSLSNRIDELLGR